MICAAVILVGSIGRVHFDSAFVRAQLQMKYDVRTANIRKGESPYAHGFSTRYRWIDLSKRQTPLSTLLKVWNNSSAGRTVFSQTVKVESADTLQDQAKAAIHLLEHEERAVGSGAVNYDRDIYAEDTWIRVGADWILLQTRVTKMVVKRNGKVISAKSENVKTDFDRQYGRRRGSG
jgi:hypothetical protein